FFIAFSPLPRLCFGNYCEIILRQRRGRTCRSGCTDRLPELSRKLGKRTNVIRSGMNEVKTHIEEEFKGIGLKGDDDARSLIKKVISAAYSQSADSPKDKITEPKGGA
ncbi:MAG TPA: hypothetical protein VLD55_01195, partial [Candidatus Sulfobium mesophilum]|nr:hypothetical protein [Candidatus Sulfobium mesophilum]